MRNLKKKAADQRLIRHRDNLERKVNEWNFSKEISQPETSVFKKGLFDRFGKFNSTQLQILKRMANQDASFYLDPNFKGFHSTKYDAVSPQFVTNITREDDNIFPSAVMNLEPGQYQTG